MSTRALIVAVNVALAAIVPVTAPAACIRAHAKVHGKRKATRNRAANIPENYRIARQLTVPYVRRTTRARAPVQAQPSPCPA
jgi:hypothetical protein